MSPAFVHLHLHTEFSLVDGVVRVKPLVNRISELNMPAVAVTDSHNLFAMVKFYKAAIAAGVKPIVGVDLWVIDDVSRAASRLILLCQNRQGYLNLTELVSLSYTQGQIGGKPRLKREWLTSRTDGLIALSGGVQGEIGQAILKDDNEWLSQACQYWTQLFPNRFYLQVSRIGQLGEAKYIERALKLGEQLSLPLVATNCVQFLHQDQFESHEARVCINQGRLLDDPHRPRDYTRYQYLRSSEEMQQLFDDIPEALENTVEIAKRCNLKLDLGNNYLPVFPIPEGMTQSEFFSNEARQGLQLRLQEIFRDQPEKLEQQRKLYEERLETEISVIVKMDFPGYFLIVADFIRWAKKNGIPVGPGRGSGAGSLVAYALSITDLDPIQNELLFERFLNPERVSMPDFDIDFCMEGRDRVIEYVAQTYGAEKVSQIITYGSMAAKAVVRDVGRVMGHGYGFVDRIAKMIPFDLGITLDKALAQEEALAELYQNDEEVRDLIDMARSLEGISRNAGKHAGGVVIAPSKLTDFTPLYCEEGGGGLVTQFDKDDVEAVGLVKFDFLGLRTLTIINWAVQIINANSDGEQQLEIERLPLDDVETFDLLKRCATTAVFQLESRGMKDLIHRLQPDNFEDIVALVALFRPGPLQSGMVDDFINRKHGRAAVEYPHPALEPILRPTYGVILYQEQVMQIAQVLAGYTLGGADLLRRAMGKKKPEEMAKQRVIFTEGAVKNGVSESVATYIFDLMEKFAGYGFNKSHSAAYALISYQTAWLKAHYPAAFMAAVLSADMDNTDKVVTLIDECKDMKLSVIPPDVNRCQYRFTVKDDNTIYYGLGAIKGIGENAINGITEAVNSAGAFADLFDFCRRVDLKRLNRRTLESLIRSGALDTFGMHRAELMANLDHALQSAEQASKNRASGQFDLFSLGQETPAPVNADVIHCLPWSDKVRLNGEKETLGLYLTGHPIDQYADELKDIVSEKISNVQSGKSAVTIAGLVLAIRTLNTRRGNKMAVFTLDDRSGRLEITAFSEVFQKYQELLQKDRMLVVKGEVGEDDYTGALKMNAECIYDIDKAREQFAKRLMLELTSDQLNQGIAQRLEEILLPFRQGHCPVNVRYHGSNASASLKFGQQWSVHPSEDLIVRLRDALGNGAVKVMY